MHQHSSNTARLCWGLFNNQASTCVVLPPCPHAFITSGWNPPLLLDRTVVPEQTKPMSLGWTHAVLLTQDGAVSVAEASTVYTSRAEDKLFPQSPTPQHSQRNHDDTTSSSSSLWRAIQLQHDRPSPAVQTAVSVTQVATGDWHCLFLDSAGCVWAMGSNRNGQLGLPVLQQHPPSDQHRPLSATQQQELAGSADDSNGSNVALNRPLCALGPGSSSSCQEHIKQVAAGACHSIAVTAERGEAYCWGWNAHGQCGTGSTHDVLQPSLCTAMGGIPLRCAAAGMAHSVLLSCDGAVYTMGWNSNGQLGLAGSSTQQQRSSSLVPMLVEHPWLDQEHAVQIACGSRHTVVLTASGKAFTWGLNKYGQCCTAPQDIRASRTDNAHMYMTGPPWPRAQFVRASAAATASDSSLAVAAAAAADVLEPHLVLLPAVVPLPTQHCMGSTPCGYQLAAAGPGAVAATADQVQDSGFPNTSSQLQQRQHHHQQQQKVGASKLVTVRKAVDISAGRWHTCIEVEYV